MTIIAKDPSRGNNIRTIDFNGQPLVTIEKGGIYYAAVKPIADNIGLDWEGQRQRINRDDVLSSAACLITATGADDKQYKMMCLPIEFLNGWLFGVDTKRVKPEIKDALIEYKKECYTVLHDYWHTGQAIHLCTTDVPSTLQDRSGLVKAIKIAQVSMGLDTCDAFNLVLHRFNISNIDDLPISQVGEATEYIHRMMLNTTTEPYRNREHTETIFGSATPIIKNNGRTTKFIGEIGIDGLMTMREMASDEFVTTLDELPGVIEEVWPVDGSKMARLGVAVSQKMVYATYNNADMLKHEG